MYDNCFRYTAAVLSPSTLSLSLGLFLVQSCPSLLMYLHTVSVTLHLSLILHKIGCFRMEIHVLSCHTENTTPAAPFKIFPCCKISRPLFGQRFGQNLLAPCQIVWRLNLCRTFKVFLSGGTKGMPLSRLCPRPPSRPCLPPTKIFRKQ